MKCFHYITLMLCVARRVCSIERTNYYACVFGAFCEVFRNNTNEIIHPLTVSIWSDIERKHHYKNNYTACAVNSTPVCSVIS